MPTAEREWQPTTSWREGSLPHTGHGKRVTRNGSRIAASGLRSVASAPGASPDPFRALESTRSINTIAEAKQRTRPMEAFTFNFQLSIEDPYPVGTVDLLPPRPCQNR